MDDIPSVLDVLKKRFKESVEKDGKLSKIRSKIQSGKNVSYKDAEDYAYRSGQLLSNTLKNGVTEEMFDQQDDFRDLITPLLKQNYDYVSNATATVQETLNHDANIGMKAIQTEFDEGMANGISNKIASYDSFEDAEWLLGDPIVSNSQGIVDDTLKANADFQYQSGMRPKVIRIAESGCCEWCASLEGEYYYPDVPEEVWHRHANCQCEVIYDPGDGRRKNVHGSTTRHDNQIGYITKTSSSTNNATSKIEKSPGRREIEVAIKEQAEKSIYAKNNVLVESIVKNHKELDKITPYELKTSLQNAGFTIKPLKQSKHGFNNLKFEEGGGYNVNVGCDGGVIRYHPEGGLHLVAYYHVCSGKEGKHWYDLKGKEFVINDNGSITYID